MVATSPEPNAVGKSAKARTDAGVQFDTVRTRRGFEYITEQIRDAISSGALAPGDRLPAERDMATQFGVSRHGVREALRGLELAGLIEIRPGVNGGAFVRSGDSAVMTRAITDLASLGHISWSSILEARSLLTANIVELACERGTEADFTALEKDTDALEELTAAGRTAERTRHLTTFYRLLAVASRNDVLVTLMQSLTDIFQARLSKVDAIPRGDVIKVRRRLLGYLRQGDAEKAVAEMTAHLERLEAHLVEQEARQANQP